MAAFVITDVGLERAATANEKGIALTIGRFAVGSAYGYEPSTKDLKIHGDTLYTNNPVSYKYVGQRTLQITCTIPANVGPFAWGEVGLYLDSGELFALAALPKPQNKYSSIESEIASSVTFNCYLTIAYNTVSIEIDYGDNPLSIVEILDGYKWSTVRLPSEVGTGISEMIVHEASPLGDSTLLIRSSEDKWTIASTYTPLFANEIPTASTQQYLDFAINDVITTALVTDAKSKYVAQFPDGSFSSFSSVILLENNTHLRFYYTDAIEQPRDLESQIVMYSAAASANDLVEGPIDISTETKGSLPWDRISNKPDFNNYGGIPIGGIILWPLDSIPNNFIVANGNAYSRTAYSQLFAVYGTRFGSGNGSTTFNVPNYIDCYPSGAGNRVKVGQILDDGLPDIVASGLGVNGPTLDWAGGLSGAFYKVKSYSGKGNGSYGAYDVGFKASLANNMYGKAAYVRPKTFGSVFIIRYR